MPGADTKLRMVLAPADFDRMVECLTEYVQACDPLHERFKMVLGLYELIVGRKYGSEPPLEPRAAASLPAAAALLDVPQGQALRQDAGDLGARTTAAVHRAEPGG